jgi:stage II sporulation protein D
MKRKLIISLMILSISVLAFSGIGVSQSDDDIRVGIYYGSTSTVYFRTAKYSGSMEIGYMKNDSYTKLLDYTPDNSLAITRDTYHHIKIGNSHDTYESALNVKNEFRNQQYRAYLAYTGKWEVWIGNFSSTGGKDGKADAEAFIKDSMEGKFNYETTVLEPSSHGFILLTVESNGYQDKYFALKVSGANLRLNTKKGDGEGILWIDSKKYRGDLEVARISGSDMTVINVVNIENYLYGVLPYEMYASSHIEALKAQAVAARTYALRNIGTSKFRKYQFDVDNTTMSQVYKGMMVNIRIQTRQ